MVDYTEIINALEKEAKLKNIPFTGTFEITNKCNLKCGFCYAHARNSLGKDMLEEELMSIIRNAVKCGLFRVTFTGGEIFCRSDFESIYCQTYDLGCRILLLTNGLLINDKICDYLKRRRPDGVSITLYGANNRDYELLTGDGEGFSKVDNSIKLLKKHNIPVSLKVLAISPLEGSLMKIRQYAIEQELKISLTKYISDFSQGEKFSLRLSPDIIYEYSRDFDNANDIIGGKKDKSSTCAISECSAGKDSFAVTPNGYIMGCLCYPEELIKIEKGDFLTALNALREKLSAKTLQCQDCVSCAYSNFCAKCGGLNYMETGNYYLCSSYRKELAKNKLI